jgi:hypothetical protein
MRFDGFYVDGRPIPIFYGNDLIVNLEPKMEEQLELDFDLDLDEQRLPQEMVQVALVNAVEDYLDMFDETELYTLIDTIVDMREDLTFDNDEMPDEL